MRFFLGSVSVCSHFHWSFAVRFELMGGISTSCIFSPLRRCRPFVQRDFSSWPGRFQCRAFIVSCIWCSQTSDFNLIYGFLFLHQSKSGLRPFVLHDHRESIQVVVHFMGTFYKFPGLHTLELRKLVLKLLGWHKECIWDFRTSASGFAILSYWVIEKIPGKEK